MLIHLLVAIAVVIVVMMIALSLVRLAAKLCLILIGLGALGFVTYQIHMEQWQAWPEIIVHAAATGAVAALLCVPLLPFRRL